MLDSSLLSNWQIEVAVVIESGNQSHRYLYGKDYSRIKEWANVVEESSSPKLQMNHLSTTE